MKRWNKLVAKKEYQSFIGLINGSAGLMNIFITLIFWQESWDAILSAGLLRTA